MFTCEVEGCSDAPRGESRYCRIHYELNNNHGTPTPTFTCRQCGKPYQFKGKWLGSSRAYCVECHELSKLYPTKSFNKHGIKIQQYHQMLQDQQQSCKVCGVTSKNLEVDHDRKCCNFNGRLNGCGKCVRGLLCRHCNTMLGCYENCQGTLVIPQFDKYLAEYRKRRMAG